jgi:hypothetical protein
MATQLRLVDPPPAAPPARKARTRTTAGASRTSSSTPARATRVGARTVKAPARRAAHWGDWQLDARTRKVGREGVAAARAALQQAVAAEPLPRAS